MRWVLLAVMLVGCAASPRRPVTSGDAIVVCGQRLPIDAPVVLWSDPGGCNAYADAAETRSHFNSRTKGLPPEEAARIDSVGWTLPQLQQRVDQVVLHYDAVGLSRECFRVLQQRKLSAHFLIDLDGTIYQTLDLRERAWHAGQANSRSIGIELANVGAYDVGQSNPFGKWYTVDQRGRSLVTIAPQFGDGGMRIRDFNARPAQPGPITGIIHDRTLVQHDFTDEQYDALARLLAGLHRTFPRLYPVAPRGGDARVLNRTLTEVEWARFSGVLGHYHVSPEKVDPGPAFDWERVLAGMRLD